MDRKRITNFLYKLCWAGIAAVTLRSLYGVWQDPQGTWNVFVNNLHDPWTYVPFGIICIVPIAVGIALLYEKYIKRPKEDAFFEEWKKSIAKSAEETRLMNENEVPDDESIEKYYKMYLKKFELDNVDTWTTAEPMSWEQWQREAKGDPDSDQFFRVRWKFMIAMTSDAFSFDPSTGAGMMMRYRDYESMI